jgi:16S rRNA (cytosine1402-N4)-methyltransferase
MESRRHVPVLLEEILAGLAPVPGDIVLDATVGDGGHSKALCVRLGTTGVLLGLDLDARALEESTEALKACPCRVELVHASFRSPKEALARAGLPVVTKAIFDLGMRSTQIDESGRGFSFLKDEPLIMTFSSDPGTQALTAGTIVNEWEETQIAQVLAGYGEERFANRIARAIVEARDKKPIRTTHELVAVIKKAVPARYVHGRLHFATRTFQALRIAVNDELTAIEEALAELWPLLAPGGRVAVISFHSLEDRIVKRFFKAKKEAGEGIILTKKPIIPKPEESAVNPRARSAKLRIIEKNHETTDTKN